MYHPDSTVDYVDKIDVLFQKCNSIYDDVHILVSDFSLDINKDFKLKKSASSCKKLLKRVELQLVIIKLPPRKCNF